MSSDGTSGMGETEDDEPTSDMPDFVPPTYEQAPPTLEVRVSPFHPLASMAQTLPGMPPLTPLDPKITQLPVTVMAPVRVGVPEPDLAGPTLPEGHPLGWDGPTDLQVNVPWDDAAPTDPVTALPKRPAPIVPSPGSPTFEISKSMEAETVDLASLPKPAVAKRPRRRHAPQAGPGPGAPTYVMLPALKRKKPAREGSDWPLVLGLLALVLVIFALVGALAWGVMRSMDEPAPAAPVAPG